MKDIVEVTRIVSTHLESEWIWYFYVEYNDESVDFCKFKNRSSARKAHDKFKKIEKDQTEEKV